MRKLSRLMPLALLMLAACSGNDSGGSQSLSSLVHQMFSFDTTDTALPVNINNLALDTSSEDASSYNDLLAPGG